MAWSRSTTSAATLPVTNMRSQWQAATFSARFRYTSYPSSSSRTHAIPPRPTGATPASAASLWRISSHSVGSVLSADRSETVTQVKTVLFSPNTLDILGVVVSRRLLVAVAP